jgi:hypothetical protein
MSSQEELANKFAGALKASGMTRATDINATVGMAQMIASVRIADALEDVASALEAPKVGELVGFTVVTRTVDTNSLRAHSYVFDSIERAKVARDAWDVERPHRRGPGGAGCLSWTCGR